MFVYVATNNAGKFEELRSIFAGYGWQLARHPAYEDVAEGDTSYAENAALKVRALVERLARTNETAAVLGDDSGLEVAALDGRPGVRSARYGGPSASWPQRRAALLEELGSSGSTDRRARFVCALHFMSPSGLAFAVERRLEGKLATNERGASGFSYDPIFEFGPGGLTFGELDERTKNRVSHRALAARALVEAVRTSAGAAPDIAASAGNTAPTGT